MDGGDHVGCSSRNGTARWCTGWLLTLLHSVVAVPCCRYERPILAAREPDASPKQTAEAARLQKELSTIVNEFILKRGNILNAQHLPPKLVQFVCCR